MSLCVGAKIVDIWFYPGLGFLTESYEEKTGEQDVFWVVTRNIEIIGNAMLTRFTKMRVKMKLFILSRKLEKKKNCTYS